MRQPLAAAGIKLRQEVFLDLEKPEVLEYLSALKLMLQDLENRYNTYHYQRHPFYKATAFLSLAEQYFAFVETACSGLPETVTAGLLRDFSSSFAAVKASLEYLRFKADGEKLRQALRSIGSVHVDIQTPDGVPVSATLSREQQPHLPTNFWQSQRSTAWPEAAPIIRAQELSLNFITGLSQLYPELFQSLEAFHEQYQGFMDSSFFAYRNQLAFYLDLKAFYTALADSGFLCAC